jgi:hypothetical protein
VHRKAKPDLYTVLLAIALVAVLIGIVFLYLEMQSYEFKIQGGPTLVMTRDLGGRAANQTLPPHHEKEPLPTNRPCFAWRPSVPVAGIPEFSSTEQELTT